MHSSMSVLHTLLFLLVVSPFCLTRVNGQVLLDTVDFLRTIVDQLPHDPDLEITPIQRVQRYGYPVEEHVLTTEDGYLLSVYRIPCGRNCTAQGGRGKGQPVLLIHGFLCSSAVFLISGPDRSLAFLLADAGYDVWAINARGTVYSTGHIDLSINPRSSYWNFSFHEMGVYDVAAHIDWIYDLKNQEGYHTNNTNDMIIISHSMGATMLYALLSTRPEYNERIAAVFNLAPIGYRTSTGGLARIVELLFNRQTAGIWFLIGDQIIPSNVLSGRSFSSILCSIPGLPNAICGDIMFIVGGYNPVQLNRTLLPLVVLTLPDQTSTKTVVHMSQLENAGGSLRHFNYGKVENLIRYGSLIPPQYDINQITVPIASFYGNKDILAPAKDVINFHEKFRNSIGLYEYPFNHMDFLFGNDASNTLYRDVIRQMRSYT